MNRDQKIVAVGAASGIVLMALSVWLLTLWLPSPRTLVDSTAGRLAYALRANVVALLPLFIMIITIANSRFLSEAIDPWHQAEPPSCNRRPSGGEHACRWSGRAPSCSSSRAAFSGWDTASTPCIARPACRPPVPEPRNDPVRPLPAVT